MRLLKQQTFLFGVVGIWITKTISLWIMNRECFGHNFYNFSNGERHVKCEDFVDSSSMMWDVHCHFISRWHDDVQKSL